MEPDILDIFNLTTNNVKPKTGRILISEPFISDGFFRRSVVLITDYSEKGASGLILNKHIQNKVALDLIKDELGSNKISLSRGGPVGLDSLVFIYRADYQLVNNSIEVIPGLYIDGSYSHLKELILEGVLDLQNVRLFLGYSGWEAGQLENEINSNFWLVKNITADEIIDVNSDIWAEQVNQLEDKYKIWTLVPEDPLLN